MMIFHELEIVGAFLIEPEKKADRRGFFARTYCRLALEDRGLDPTLVQCNVSVNSKQGTVRGMHWQSAPYEEIKMVRCTAGSILDVVLDLRPDSPTYLRHSSAELTRDNRLALYIPAGCAHGFQSLEDDTEVFFQMSEFHYPDHAQGARWDDPAFNISWPLPISQISERDCSFPDFNTDA